MTEMTIVIMVVDGVIMMDGVIEGVVDGSRVPMSMFTLVRLTPLTDTMRILLHMGITDTLLMGTMGDTRTKDGILQEIEAYCMDDSRHW